MRAWTSCAVVLCALVAGGCAGPLRGPVPESRLVASGRYVIVEGLEVPRGGGSRGCGAQALATVFAHADPETDAQAECDRLPWREAGATPVELLLAARARGFEAELSRGSVAELRGHVVSGVAPLVLIDMSRRGREVYHWAVVSGVGADGSDVLLGGEGARHYLISGEEFARRWSRTDYCTIVVRAGPTR